MDNVARPFRIRTGARGREVYAARDLDPGTVVMQSLPVALSPLHERVCQHCLAKSSTCCGGCRTIRYCGRDCQKLDWGLHKAECGKMAALSSTLANDHLQKLLLLHRLLRRFPDGKRRLEDSKEVQSKLSHIGNIFLFKYGSLEIEIEKSQVKTKHFNL